MIFLYAFGLAYLTWFFFLAIMSLKQAKDAGKLTAINWVLGYPIGIVGWLLDFTINMTLGTFLFLEIPQEWLLTVRCDRNMTYGSAWRAKLAWWLCSHLLDPFQQGGHCHKIGG